MWWNGVDAEVKTVTNAVRNVGEGIRKVVGYELVLPGISDEGGNDDEEVRGWWGRTECCALCHRIESRHVRGCID